MKKVLITGASSGIGAQLAEDYLHNGWQVVACGRDFSKSKLINLQDTRKLQLCSFDIGDAQECEQVLSSIKNIDLAILNAGCCEYVDEPMKLDVELFSRVMKTNFLGTVHCLAPVIKNMVFAGRIAIMSSSVTHLALPRSEAYGASKAALDYLCRSLAIDLAPKGIAFSLIQPGFVDTPLTKKNNFPMPGIISLNKASSIIQKALAKGRSHISFPFVFIAILKLLSFIPQFLWQPFASKFLRRES